ncbi:hypothetical protein [Micromonospora sp. b486]|uniref:hypothetical protein n=1 Tax=Micromonospora sp. b486 TaxID=3053986 RepID=UPI00259C804D|nr:hypothetical protein [Micromonospora sp. b486]MDM4778047.1 hypothetical protein [Micromonospora sp. b486]
MRWPIAAAIVPTAAVGAKTGFGLPNRLNASHQDSAAARPGLRRDQRDDLQLA